MTSLAIIGLKKGTLAMLAASFINFLKKEFYSLVYGLCGVMPRR
jgi:hypothetical protein